MRIAVIDDESIFRMQLQMMVEKIAAEKEICGSAHRQRQVRGL